MYETLFPIVFFAVFFGIPVTLMMVGSSLRKRRKLAADIRPALDPSTQEWLRAREERFGSRPKSSRLRMFWTQNLEQPPAGTHRVLFAFDYKDGRRGGYGTLVGAEAHGWPTEVVAMRDMPGPFVRMFAPGFEVVERDQCPPGWALAIAPDSSSPPPDSALQALLRSLTPDPTLDEPGAPAHIVAAVDRCQNRNMRIHFGPERIYLAVDSPHVRPAAVELVEYMATQLPVDR